MLRHVISVCRHEFQKWMRQRTRPMTIEEAEEKRFFWAKVYALSAIAVLIYCTHSIYHNPPHFNKKSDAPKELLSSFIFTSDRPVRYLKFKGFTKVSDVTYSPDELDRFLAKPENKSSITEDPANSDTG